MFKRSYIKKIISEILIVALFLVATAPAYAVATGSSITLDDHLSFMTDGGIKPIEEAAIEAAEIKAAAATPSGTQTDPIYVRQSIGDTTVNWFFLDTDVEEDDIYENVHGYYSGFEGLSWSVVHSLKNLNDYLWYHQIQNDDGTTSEAGLLLIERNLLGSYVALLEMQPVLNTISSRVNTTNTRLTATNNSLSAIITDILAGNALIDWSGITSGGTYTLPRYRQVANGGTSSDLTPVTDARNPISNIWYMANNINTSMVYGLRDLLSGVSVNSNKSYLDKDLQSVSLGRVSMWNDIRMLGTNINDIVARLGYVFASDEEIAARAEAASTQEAVVDDFISSTGSASASTSDYAQIAEASHLLKDGLSTNVSPSNIFNVFDDDNSIWDWFTSNNANALDNVVSRQRGLSNTPLVDQYYDDIYDMIGK